MQFLMTIVSVLQLILLFSFGSIFVAYGQNVPSRLMGIIFVIFAFFEIPQILYFLS
jgi:hypothetical protein